MLTELLIGAFILSVIGTYVLEKNGYFPDYVSTEGPLLLFHSRKGLSLVDKMARQRSVWRVIATMGIVVSFVGMILGSLGLGASAVSILLQPESASTTQPSNFLAIPGVNDFLPLSEAIEIFLALLIGVVLHEGGHAVLCRVEDIDIDSTGVAFVSILPMGAFVEPNEESKDNASHFGRARMAAAGIVQNLALTVICLVLLLLLVSTMITPTAGVPVGSTYDGTAAQDANLEGEVIVSVDGTQVESSEEFFTYLDEANSDSVTVTTASGEEATLERAVLPVVVNNDIVTSGVQMTAVDGQQVNTVADVRSVAEQTTAISTLTTPDGQIEMPLGAQVRLETGEVVYITEFAGERVTSGEELQTLRDGVSSDSSVTYYSQTEDGYEQTTTTLQSESIEFVWAGVSGVQFSETGVIEYPAETYLGILQFSDSVVDEIGFGATFALFFFLPFLSLIPLEGFAFNFGGFTPNIEPFFTTTGPDGVVLFTATFLFWSVWLNLNLAIFNSLPIWMLDGQHILRDTIRGVEERNEWLGRSLRVVEYGVPALALLAFLVVVLAPFLVQYIT